MKARFVNEIKQNVSGSGLEPIGIGKSSLFPGLMMAKNKYPEIFKVFDEYNNVISEDTYTDFKIRKYLKKINISPNDAVWAYVGWLIHSVVNENIDEFKNIWWNGVEKISPDSTEDYVIFYNKDLKIGSAITHADDDDEMAEYFFIIDK